MAASIRSLQRTVPTAIFGIALIAVIIVVFAVVVPSTGGWSAGWALILDLVALMLFAATLVATIPIIRQDSDSTNGVVAALGSTAALVPITVAEAGSVIAFIAPQALLHSWAHAVQDLALAIGTLSALVVWFAVSWFYRHSATAERQNVEVYAELCQRYAELDAQLATWCVDSANVDPVKRAAYVAACAHRDAIASELGLGSSPAPKGLRWVLATGYIAVWKRLHRAEEALISIQPTDIVASEAVFDEMRIQGSNLPTCPQLVSKIRYALQAISPSVLGALTSPTGPPHQPDSAPSGLSEAEARGILRQVRYVLDEYRDQRWDGLVRERNHLIETVIFTRVTAFILLALAILLKVPPYTILAAAVFYLTGAAIGFFNQLRPVDNGTQTPVEDYGLFSASLIQTPVFSGLAGVGGVLITTMVVAGLTHGIPTLAQTSAAVPSLADIFNLNTDRFGIVVAALFGLTPQLLINRLQDMAAQYKSDIGSTQASAPHT
jgi:hypothetical protein